MLSIFLCISWPSACSLWRNVYLGLLPIFCLFVCLFFDIELHELFRYFGELSFVSCLIWKHFLQFQVLSFYLVYGLLCYAKDFKFNQVPFVKICFYFHYSRKWARKDPVVIYVKECSMWPLYLISPFQHSHFCFSLLYFFHSDYH